MAKIIPIILAGGTGSRLWPVSREMYPKQLLRLTGERSLLQNTVARVAKLESIGPIYVVVGEEHRFTTKSQIDELGLGKDYKILLEPLGRNTAPAISGTAEYICNNGGEDDVLLVLPADHLIKKEDAFQEAVTKAALLAKKKRIVTFGMTPTRPETGYGYIEKGEGHEVLSFKEKPGVEVAKQYLESGKYFWNSGMFCFSVDTFRKEMDIHAPTMLEIMANAAIKGREDDQFFRFNAEIMEAVKSNSIDYVLMEKTKVASVVEADLGWSDIGSWQALWEVLDKNDSGNVVEGDVIVESVSNSLIRSEDKLVAAIGLEDTIIIETADAVLVSSLDQAQDVKKVVEHLKANGREEFRYHRTVYRPWGSYTVLEEQKRYQMKRIVVNPGAKLSLQKHYHRYEHWVVVSGTAQITNGDDVFLLYENQSTYIPAGVVHRLENQGVIPLELIEVQIGSYLGEDDIVRYDDDYGREEFELS